VRYRGELATVRYRRNILGTVPREFSLSVRKFRPQSANPHPVSAPVAAVPVAVDPTVDGKLSVDSRPSQLDLSAHLDSPNTASSLQSSAKRDSSTDFSAEVDQTHEARLYPTNAHAKSEVTTVTHARSATDGALGLVSVPLDNARSESPAIQDLGSSANGRPSSAARLFSYENLPAWEDDALSE